MSFITIHGLRCAKLKMGTSLPWHHPDAWCMEKIPEYARNSTLRDFDRPFYIGGREHILFEDIHGCVWAMNITHLPSSEGGPSNGETIGNIDYVK